MLETPKAKSTWNKLYFSKNDLDNTMDNQQETINEKQTKTKKK